MQATTTKTIGTLETLFTQEVIKRLGMNGGEGAGVYGLLKIRPVRMGGDTGFLEVLPK